MHVLQGRFVAAEGAVLEHAGLEVLHDVGADPVILLIHHLADEFEVRLRVVAVPALAVLRAGVAAEDGAVLTRGVARVELEEFDRHRRHQQRDVRVDEVHQLEVVENVQAPVGFGNAYLWMKQDFIKGNITPAVGRLLASLVMPKSMPIRVNA